MNNNLDDRAVFSWVLFIVLPVVGFILYLIADFRKSNVWERARRIQNLKSKRDQAV